MAEHEARRVGLFVTCLIDLIRPTVGFAAVKLLESARCIVDVPLQSCCGQPAFNSGDRATTRDIAMQVIAAFEPFDYVVAPSGSCAGMLKVHYPELFLGDPNWQPRADAFAAKTYELVSFLVDVCGMKSVAARLAATATYHDSCSGLRELGVRAQPRALLRTVDGLKLAEMRDADVCCGFGGTFCVKYPDISNAIVDKKAANIAATGADLLARRRSRLPHEHGRQAAARGPRHRGPSRRRGARRDDPGAGHRPDRRGGDPAGSGRREAERRSRCRSKLRSRRAKAGPNSVAAAR